MTSTQSKSSSIPARIVGVQFSMLSPDEIRKNSVVEITSRDTYINNKPVIGGLFDPRMGVLEPGTICPTDGKSYIDTPGYFGHIELARPVFFIQHIKETMKIVQCVCFKCSKLLINKNQHKHILKKSAEERWKYVSHLAAKVKRCGENTDDGCGCKQPESVKLEGMSSIYASWKTIVEDGETMMMKLTPEIVLKIFKRISDDDVSFMGFNPLWSRPEWMIAQALPVPPPAVRPSVKHDAQQRSEDDLTHIYSNIIKFNNILKEKMAMPETQANLIEGWTDILQHSIAMVVNNKIKGVSPMAQRSGRPLQCIMGRLNSKYGRIRGNLMGKRVDFSARSVITGDPNLSIKQLGVPLKIAMNLTKPVVVNNRNRDFLMTLIQNGPEKYPGAKILERANGENISLRYVDRASVKLENGDIVHRHMMDGDAVLFNRQPSLHRQSMMCHIAKIMRVGDTFRMNVGDTKPYNADFDGDEMNMHMPQNIAAETELRTLAAIPYQIVSPTGNVPLIGIYQDSLLGSYRLTRPDINMTPLAAMGLLMMYPRVDVDAIRAKGKVVSSFDVLSQIMPPLTLTGKTKLFDEDKDDVKTSNNFLEIRAGKYTRGQLEKSALGSSTKGILHRIHNDFGSMACADFNDNLQNIVTEYMKTSSYSVGISDLIANQITQNEITQSITKQKLEVQGIIDQLHLGIFENNTSNSNMVEFEMTVNNTLNKATEQSGKIGRKSLSADNRFLMIVLSGSKGSLINISQMISCLGQQNVDGKRIPYGFDNRTLPHFSKFDDSPTARGFVENSYISGLSAPELFFHAMGGRIGLIDTAVKTSQTGYIQRRLIKGLEDIKVEYDMTVRNSKGKIIQFQYGDDGFDSTRVENQVIPLVGMSLEDIYIMYDFSQYTEDKTESATIYTKGTYTRFMREKAETDKRCRQYIDKMVEARDEIADRVFRYKNDNGVRMPVAFQYIVANVQGQLGLNNRSSIDITPIEAFDLIEEYFKKLNTIYYMKTNPLFEIMYYYYLSPRDLLEKRRFNRKALITLLETVVLKFKEAIVHPGEMVGVIAGQSIGEPTTQLTLNTFHLAGVASKSNVTRGVPRIEEILRLTKNPKKPSLTVQLKPMDEQDKDRAITFSNMMEHTKLIDVVKSVQICFDPDERNTNIIEDRLLLEQYHEFERLVRECNEDTDADTGLAQKSKWIVRIEIDKTTLLDKNITMDDIHFAITNSSHSENITCVFADYNSDKLIFRIRMNSSVFSKSDKAKKAMTKMGMAEPLDQSDEIYMLKNFQDTLLNNIVLRGIPGIQNVLPRKIQNSVIKEDGKFVTKDTWVLDTTGTNLLDALALDFIDNTRTYSNDIKEMFDVLGIEAARQVIQNELTEVMEASDVYINYHHVSILCDRMTCNKDMVSIFRSGLLNDDTGPIAKATFEVHTEVLLDASRHADLDHMRGISANVMCGQIGYFGTGAFELVLDMKAFENAETVEVDTKTDNKRIEELFGKIEDVDDKCSAANLKIQNNVTSMKHNDSGVCDDEYNIGF